MVSKRYKVVELRSRFGGGVDLTLMPFLAVPPIEPVPTEEG